MNRNEFILKLKNEMQQFPQEDVSKTLDYYSEMIDDRMEDGLSEEQAVAALGDVEDIVKELWLERPITELVKSKINKKRRLSWWEITLILLGAPIWLSILIGILAVVLSVYIAIFAVIISLFAVVLALAVCLPIFIAVAIVFVMRGYAPSAAFILGVGFISAGLSIFGFMAAKALAKLLIKLGKLFLRAIKSIFISKEEAL